MCCNHHDELAVGCKHLCAGTPPDVLLAEDVPGTEYARVTYAMCKPCADWYDAEGCKLDPEDHEVLGRLYSVCLICHDYKYRVPFGGFWLANGDGTYTAQKTSIN
jgi:hypothetical protein